MLSGAWNFRDLSDLKTYDGRCVGAGFLFRSSELSGLDEVGAKSLTDLGVTDVLDLRDIAEVQRSGADRVPAGIEVHALPFGLSHQGRPPHEMTPAEYEAARGQYMLDVYRSIPALPGAMAAINMAIKTLVDPRRRVLAHCAAGKDRAGWLTAMVLDSLGVRREEIFADYLISNNDIDALHAHLKRVYDSSDNSGKPFVISPDILGVREEFLETAYTAMSEGFGSLGNYLTACQVSEADLEALRDRLLV
jgi:protein-tyrosine phosphatase